MKARLATPAPARRPALPGGAGVRPAPAGRLSCACGGRCPRCSGAEAAAHQVALAAQRDPEADRHAGVSGGTLRPAQQRFFERHVGAPLDGVRIETGPAARAAARGARALAFTHGDRVVLGAPGGAALLAHELAHVAQQRAGLAQGLQRADDGYAEEYHRPDNGRLSTYTGLSVARYERLLGPTQGSGKGVWGAHRFPIGEPITPEEMRRIFPDFGANAPPEVFDAYLKRLNDAFRVFRIDTVEAQAAWLANAMHESAQFRLLTETEGALQGYTPYQQDPAQVKLNTAWLEQAAAGQLKGVAGYASGGSILTRGHDWNRSFIGRGPVQLTHRHNYLQALVVMAHRADELEAEGSDPQGVAALREAVAAIRADPRQAANPQYTFLFSISALKMPGEKGRRADQIASSGSVTGWMGPQPAAVKKDKEGYYAKIKAELMKKYEAQRQRATPQAPAR